MVWLQTPDGTVVQESIYFELSYEPPLYRLGFTESTFLLDSSRVVSCCLLLLGVVGVGAAAILPREK